MGSIYESIEKNGVHPSVSHEAEELIHCGLTSYELEFIMLNCGRLNFSVNIFSIHHQHIYPVHIGIGASRNAKKAAQATVINIFKLSMHAGDLSSKQRYDDGKMWDQMLSQGNTIINRNESEKEIELALEMSETQEEQKIRKIKNQKYSQFPPYKEQFEKNHIRWANELKAAESVLIENHFFAINDLNRFLKHFYDKKKKSARRAKFCPRCIRAFYSDNALENHKNVSCGKKEYYRETKRYRSCCQHSYDFGHAFIQKDICQFYFDEAAYENNVARENLRKIAKVQKDFSRKKKDHDFN